MCIKDTIFFFGGWYFFKSVISYSILLDECYYLLNNTLRTVLIHFVLYHLISFALLSLLFNSFAVLFWCAFMFQINDIWSGTHGVNSVYLSCTVLLLIAPFCNGCPYIMSFNQYFECYGFSFSSSSKALTATQPQTQWSKEIMLFVLKKRIRVALFIKTRVIDFTYIVQIE